MLARIQPGASGLLTDRFRARPYQDKAWARNQQMCRVVECGSPLRSRPAVTGPEVRILPSALTNLEENVYTDNRKESIMAEEVFIKVRLYSYGQSGAGSYLYYGSGLIGVTENRNCQSPG